MFNPSVASEDIGGRVRQTRRRVRWITNLNSDGTGYEPALTFQSGCGLGDCLGFCDKSMFGLCSDRQVGRFAVCQFGHTVSNGPLFVLTSTICSYCSQVHDADAQQFVDDLTKALRVGARAACFGLDGSCPI
jgi:hypothetical protein